MHWWGQLLYGGKLCAHPGQLSQTRKTFEPRSDRRPNGVSFVALVPYTRLLSDACLNGEGALETYVASIALLRVNDAAGGDHLVFPTHACAFHRPILNHSLDHGCALHVVLEYVVVRGELEILAIDMVEGLNPSKAFCLLELENFPGKKAAAGIATDDACHVWQVGDPFEEGYFDSTRNFSFVRGGFIQVAGECGGDIEEQHREYARGEEGPTTYGFHKSPLVHFCDSLKNKNCLGLGQATAER